MKTLTKSDSTRRLNRIAGQVSGIQRMVEEERACGDILQQVVAVRAALDQLGIVLLTEHLQTCVLHQNVGSADDCCKEVPEELWSDEIRSTLTRFLK
jgi:CsoR family transcriptional regulator, copper-sensing transcriptional repressor